MPHSWAIAMDDRLYFISSSINVAVHDSTNTGGLAHRDDPLLDSAGRPTPRIYLFDALCACPFSRDIAAGFI